MELISSNNKVLSHPSYNISAPPLSNYLVAPLLIMITFSVVADAGCGDEGGGDVEGDAFHPAPVPLHHPWPGKGE